MDVKFDGPIANYRSSETITRSFCSHCGANVYFQDFNEPRPDVCTGTLAKVDGILKLRHQTFVKDTKDGGLSAWIDGVPAYEGFSHQSKQPNYINTDQSRRDPDGSTELRGYCQCKGVQFKVSRPDASSMTISSPYPDLLKPYHSQSRENMEDVKWWLRANDTKYLAGICACHSCRLASGFDVQVWAFVPKTNILQGSGEPLDFNSGTLKQYRSSEGVYREFCSKCGATVFWHCDARRDVIDVSVGLLDASEGARAESWLEWWTDRISWQEEGQNKDLISRLSAGLKQWGKSEALASAT